MGGWGNGTYLLSVELQELEDNLPEAEEYKQKVEGGSPIRVIQLIYTSGVSGKWKGEAM